MQYLSAKLKKHILLTRAILVLIAGLTVYKLMGYLYFLFLSSHYGSYIPTSFEIEKTVFVDDQIGGFIEGCGVGIFRLSDNTAAKISGGGVEFLNQNSTTNDRTHQQYKKWQETPFDSKHSEFPLFGEIANSQALYTGASCVDIPEPLKIKILSATRSPGAFYSGFNKKTELIVIPSYRLAVFSHDR